MEAYLLDWANLVVPVAARDHRDRLDRFLVLLGLSRQQPAQAHCRPTWLRKRRGRRDVAVHGGGFYNPQKYMVAPKKIHTELHWFYWESYSTWLSGFCAVHGALPLERRNLPDRQIADGLVAGGGHFGVALGFLVAFWLIYDRICQWSGFREKVTDRRGNGCSSSWWPWLPGWRASCCRARSFPAGGAMIATAMSANVFFWIIPGQRKVVAAMTSGEPDPDSPGHPRQAWQAAQRAQHLLHAAGHFRDAEQSLRFLTPIRHNWLVLILMMLAGGADPPVLRAAPRLAFTWAARRIRGPCGVGVAIIVIVIAGLKAMAPGGAGRHGFNQQFGSRVASRRKSGPNNFKTVNQVLEQRCLSATAPRCR